MKKKYVKEGIAEGIVHRDAHDPSKVYIETKIHDKGAIERNTQIREAGLLREGDFSPLHDDEIIRYAMSFPTYQNYQLVVKAQPELMKQAQSKDDDERYRAMRKLQILFPQFVVSQDKKRFIS